ncbi:MAG: response regulator [Phreatobacter sp.]|uniref:response regulator n=1 Tax=Phreatobacter sp. TaxID=1966341 RepID=UPI002732A0C5|nr:response regulator [Phreatobacter sp.]MDP2802611.1 response regulator [Phreatobacter sp.]
MSLEGVSIILVEDDPIMGESLVQRLGLEGAEVVWFRSRGEASHGLAGASADVVICDIRLPDGTGEDVFLHAGRSGPIPPFLFMTAFADIDQAVRLMKAGAGDYIAKPFEMQKLLARVLGILGERHGRTAQIPDLKLVRGEAERALIERTIAETGGRIGEAARRLNVSRTTLWSRMKVLGVAGPRSVQKTEHGPGRLSK